MLTVSKFGGTSLKDGAMFLHVCELVKKDPNRRGVVVSAPGRRFGEDEKVTDLLYTIYRRRQGQEDWQGAFDQLAGRFRQIVRHTGAFVNIEAELDALKERIEKGVTEDFLVSRGEYLSALILASLLGWKFIDSAHWLRFTAKGQVDTVRSYGLLRRLADCPFVTPGFYGAGPGGAVQTFPRGGSDITASLVAAALEADLCENWTDVDGVLMADPRLIPEAKPVRHLTYSELAELTAVGTQVLHEGAVRPLRQEGIPLSIRNTFSPASEGTLITPALAADTARGTLLCVAGKRNRALVSLETEEHGLLAQLLREAEAKTDVFTCALGRQTAVISGKNMEALTEHLICQSADLHLQDDVALLAAVVAREEEKGPLAADLLTALKEKGIPVHAMFRAFGSHTLLFCIDDQAFLPALTALYNAAEK